MIMRESVILRGSDPQATVISSRRCQQEVPAADLWFDGWQRGSFSEGSCLIQAALLWAGDMYLPVPRASAGYSARSRG